MKVKLKVLVPFTDKNDHTVRYKKGDTVDGIAIGDKSYPVAAVKVALEAIGVTVSKNAGIPAVSKAVAGLTDDELAKLAETLTASEA